MSKQEIQIINQELLKTMPLPEPDDGKVRQPGAVLIVMAEGQKHRLGSAILAARAALRTGCQVYLAGPESLTMPIAIAVPEITPLSFPEIINDKVDVDAAKVFRKQASACNATFVSENIHHQMIRPTRPKDSTAVTIAPNVLLSDHQVTTHAKTEDHWQGFEKDPAKLKQLPEPYTTIVQLHADTDNAFVYSPQGAYTLSERMGVSYIAGSSDVLSGIIIGLLAQDMTAIPAAIWSVHLYTLALEAATKDFGDEGVTASDVIRYIPGSIRYARRTLLPRKETSSTGFRRNL